MTCPICKNQLTFLYGETNKENLCAQAYKRCLNCGLSFQDPLPPKMYEGPEEGGTGPGTGHLMSDEDKKVNSDLATYLQQKFHPQTVLDIGCKYPYFLSQFKDIHVQGIDAVKEVEAYGDELGVPVWCCAFEELGEVPAGMYDLITLIHTFEHFYNPIRSLKTAIQCLSKNGVLFIRIPNADVKGIEKDLTEHHLKIHPYIYSTQTMYALAEKLGLEIFQVDHSEGAGQSDFYMRVRKGRPELSVCMIVRDESRDVGDCLESIKGIADEIIVVDTGSIDNTKEVVSAYTDLIYDFKWVDDFSAARNYSLSKATGKWVMWMDADDVLQNPEAVKKVLVDKFDVYNFNIIYGGDIFCHARLFRNNFNVKFAGRVHEYPIIDGLPFLEKTDINVIHKTEKMMDRPINRSERNLSLLKQELAADSNNTRALFYMGNTLRELGQYEEAKKVYERYLTFDTWCDEKWMARKNIGFINLIQGHYRTAMLEFEKAIEIDDRWAESYYYIGESYFHRGMWEKCIQWMLKALDKDMPDSPLWKETLVYGDGPHRYISACYTEMGEFKRALDELEKVEPTTDNDREWLKNRKALLKGKLNKTTKNIVCYRQGALGDCLMTTSALRGLKDKYPGCHITYVTSEHSMQILEGNKYIDELTTICETPNRGIYFEYPIKSGYPTKAIYHDRAAYSLPMHLIKTFNKCANVGGEYLEGEYPMECTLTEKEERVGLTLKNQFKKYVTLHPQAGWSPYKNWYDDRWADVTEYLFKKGYVTVLLGHADDPLLVNVVDFRGHTVKEAIAAIKHADLHIGVDSFSNHASACMETPAVILFGSTSPTGSGYDQNINIYSDIECQPCYLDHNSPGKCPHNKKCIDMISTEEVIAAVDKFLP